MSALRVAPLLVVVVGLVPVAGAAAQEPGVTIDPSPATKEYAIPFQQARKDAAGPATPAGSQGDAAASGTAKAPLFGVGVTPDRARDATRPATGAAKPAGKPGSKPAQVFASSMKAAADHPSSDRLGVSTAVGGLAGSLLLLGGVLGSIVRRQRHRG